MKCPLRLFAGDSQWLLPPPPKGLHDLEQLVMVQETLGSRILHQDHCFFAYLGANRSLLMGIEVGIFFSGMDVVFLWQCLSHFPNHSMIHAAGLSNVYFDKPSFLMAPRFFANYLCNVMLLL